MMTNNIKLLFCTYWRSNVIDVSEINCITFLCFSGTADDEYCVITVLFHSGGQLFTSIGSNFFSPSGTG